MKKILFGLLIIPSFSLAVRGPSDPLTAGFQIFPSSAIWNTNIETAIVSSSNSLWINTINGHAGHNMHIDFGTSYLGAVNGIPYVVTWSSSVPKVSVSFSTPSYQYESDAIPAGGLPIPTDSLIEGDPYPGDPYVNNSGSDKHLILVDISSHTLWEMNQTTRTTGSFDYTFNQLSKWDLNSNTLRQDNYTSAEAGGLPIYPMLIKPWEIQQGAINHALRFTLELTYGGHIWPARHDANSGGPLNPPFGMRVRMKSTFNPSASLCSSTTNQIIITAMKKYGMFLSDNGGDWFVSGAPGTTWDSDDLAQCFNSIFPINSFEVVDESTWIVDPDSARGQSPVIAPTTMTGSVEIH